MLVYILAIAVGLTSFAFYMAAFFFPEVHRKDDFLWSGVGLFYALVLWVCAGRITGGILLGQIAAAALLVWFGWETLTLRRAIAHPEARTEVTESFSLTETVQNLFSQVVSLFSRRSPEPKPTQTQTATLEDTQPIPETPTGEQPAVIVAEATQTDIPPEATPQSAPAQVPTAEQKITEAEGSSTEMPPAEPSIASAAETSEAVAASESLPSTEPQAAPKKRGLPFGRLFGRVSRPQRRGKPEAAQTSGEETEVPSESPIPGIDVAASTTVEQSETSDETVTPSAPPAPETVEAAQEESQSKPLDVANETQATPPNPPDPEMVKAAQEDESQEKPQIDVEEVAPEAQLTPPAEPIGDSDPKIRQELRESAGETPSGLKEKPSE